MLALFLYLNMENQNIYDVIIVGSGPAGLTAGIYAARGSRKTLILAGRKWGGQLMLTTEVENFPGFPEPIMGPELMKRMRDQAVRCGAEILDVNFVSADYSKKPFEVVSDDDKKYYSKSIIISTGADTKWLQIPGEEEKIGRGISSCAPCDAAFYRNKKVVVIGGGDSAMEEALVLTKFASEVYLIHRRDSFKASDAMQQKVFKNEKIKIIWNTSPVEVLGEMKVESIKLKTGNEKIKIKENNQDKEVSIEEIGGKALENGEWEFPTDGIFVAIGHTPNSSIFEGIEKDEKGFIKQYPNSATNIEGVFVSGDVHDSHYMQGITAAAFGCMSALDVEKYLQMGE
jgi:thioredoxin reductase (NADPH)